MIVMAIDRTEQKREESQYTAAAATHSNTLQQHRAVTTEIDSLIYQFSKQSEIFERKQKPKTKAKSAAKAER